MKDQFKKYIWIVDQLYRTGGITYKELARRWEQSGMNDLHTKLPKRTFDDYRRAIEDTFDIDIICDASHGYEYRIQYASDIQADNVKSWLLSSFAVNNLLQESKLLRNRVMFEEVPSGNAHLITVLKAMRDGRVLDMHYQDYYDSAERQLRLNPYCVRVFRKRWYVIGADNHNKEAAIRRYALDRTLALHATDEPFHMPASFSMERYFKDAFGIIVERDEYDVETIRLKVYDHQHKRSYFRSLPLHESQKETSVGRQSSVFEYRLMPTYDFIQELLSHADEIEVLEPAWLRQDMRQRIERMLKRYED